MWLDQPDRLGYWIFVGSRTTRVRSFIYYAAAPVEVMERDGYKGWIVFYSGSGMAYSLAQHEGIWFYLGELIEDGRKLVAEHVGSEHDTK